MARSALDARNNGLPKRSIGVLSLFVCLGALGCATSGTLPVRNEEGVTTRHEANRPKSQGKIGPAAPWIFDGKPGTLTPTNNDSLEVYGVVHGGILLVFSESFIIEQWMLMQKSEGTHYGITFSKYPEFLPLVEKDVIREDTLFWKIGRDPFGTETPKMDGLQFYHWAVPLMAPETRTVIYGFGIARPYKGVPPDHLDALTTTPIDLGTEGYVESFTLSDKCHLAVFADLKTTPFRNSTGDPFLDQFNRMRRIVQAYGGKCDGLFGSSSAPVTAKTSDVPRKEYRKWLELIDNWQADDVNYADGTVYINDNFKGDPLEDLQSKIAPLMKPMTK